MPEAFKEDFFERVVNVQWNKPLYLEVAVGGGNLKFLAGPASPFEQVNPPKIIYFPFKHTKLIESTSHPEHTNNFWCLNYRPQQTGFIDFGPWYVLPDGLLWADPIYGPIGMSAVDSYNYWRDHVGFSYPIALVKNVSGSCPTPPPIEAGDITSWSATAFREATYYHQMASTPATPSTSATVNDDRLYTIQPEDNLLRISVADIIQTINSEGVPYAGFISNNGNVSITLTTYSRYRGSLTLAVINSDNAPTPDDYQNIHLTSDNQGIVTISVHLDTDPTHRQIDDYGVSYQPYKITAKLGY